MDSWYQDLFESLEKMHDKEQGAKMSAYMQNRFPFLGVPKPVLKQHIKPYFQKSRKMEIDWDFVHLCWKKPYREAQYIAIEYILLHEKQLLDTDIDKVRELITEKSWWETVDSLDSVAGTIVLNYPYLKEKMRKWSISENIWLRRVAIDFQQKYKEKTDSNLLEEIICNNLGTNEFFIDKAIGWSLRDYSKVNPEWVRIFLERHKGVLSNLSIKEASKYL
ncbi:DNA alkylation repair protein [Faecalispora jeddahensis]|uniref:DNA alkylation repair protein n=1 Tax=Faecalispora jeddahensis TaxID=1414721 RepID=UPI00189A2831|nr:DNA alkylation repair protein [Faecalispora jeddahensis]